MPKKQTFFLVLIVCFLVLAILVYFNTNESLSIGNIVKTIKTGENESFKHLIENGTAKNYVFIDLGANKGDSIYNFFGIETNDQSPYNFPQLLDRTLVKQVSWIVYAFEANPVFDNDLYEMKNKLNNLGHIVHLFNRTAAWKYDGKIDFYLDLINVEKNFWGSR
jgi:hypothetical protein